MTAILYLGIIVIKILAARYCSRKAAALNRNVAGWGIFGFLSPLIAYFWINTLSVKGGGIDDTYNKPIDQI